MDPALVARVRRLYDTTDLASGVAAVLEFAHPDIEIVVAAGWVDMETTFTGRDGVRAYFAGLEEVFENMRYELVSLEDHGEALVADIVVHVEGRGSGATGSVPVTQVLWFEDGLARRIRGFSDREEALRAVS
jgi:ketosteroid isomerase-like protein